MAAQQAPQIGQTEDGHSYIGGDPSNPQSWKAIGSTEDGHVFNGGDPANPKSWTAIQDTQPSMADTFVNAVGNQAAFGYLPQLQAATEPAIQKVMQLIGGDNTDRNLQAQGFNIQGPDQNYVQRRDQYINNAQNLADANPTTSTIGSILGAIAGGVGAGGAIAKTAGAGLGAIGGLISETPTGEALINTGRAMYQGSQGATMAERLGQAATAAGAQGLLRNPGDTQGEISPLQAPERFNNGLTDAATGLIFQRGLEALGLGGAHAPQEQQAQPTSEANSASAENPSGLNQNLQNLNNPSDREIVNNEMARLQKIAKEQNLPEPTIAQATGGDAIAAEKRLMDVPIIGKSIRDHADNQVKAVRQNLENEVGNFIHTKADPFQVGEATKDLSNTNVQVQKQIASNLYDQVAQEAGDAEMSRSLVSKKIMDKAKGFGLFGYDNEPLPYRSDSGLPRDTFEKLQQVVGDAKEALISPVGDKKINYDSAAQVMRTIKGEAQDASKTNPRLSGILKGMGDDLQSSIQSILNRENPGAGEKFREAGNRWAQFRDHESFVDKVLGDKVSPENVMNKVMANTNNIDKMKEVIGEDKVRELALAHMNNIINKTLTGSGVGRADATAKALQKLESQYTQALGTKTYNNVMDNLSYLSRVNENVDIARQSMYTYLGRLSDIAKNTVHTVADLKTTGRIQNPLLQSEKDALKSITPTIPQGAKDFVNDNSQYAGRIYNLLKSNPSNAGTPTYQYYGNNQNNNKRSPGSR